MKTATRMAPAIAVMIALAAAQSLAQVDSIPPTPEVDTTAVTGPQATADNVKRATFTSDVVNREPVDHLDSLATTTPQVYFFTEIVGLEGGVVVHRWTYNGETVGEVNCDIGGPRWRVYSVKKLDPEKTGEWKVEVTDPHGYVLATKSLIYYTP